MPEAAAPGVMEMFGFWRSQAAFRVRVALNLKGIAYREIPIDLDRGEQNAPDYLAINPLGSVPALMVEGEPLTQSMAILEYLDEVRRDPPLLPDDAIGRARVRSLAAIAVSDAHPLIVPRIRRYLAEHAGFTPSQWTAWQTRWFSGALRGIEARLSRDDATGAFCHGDTPGLADICLAGLHAGAKTFGIVTDGIETVDSIVARCMELPAFANARADRQAGFPG